VSDGRTPEERPKRAEIERALKRAGLRLSQCHFYVDDDGVDNVDIYPLGEADANYRAKTTQMISFSARSGAAVGIHFGSLATQPKRRSFLQKVLGLGR
jgi:hypothetical protein